MIDFIRKQRIRFAFKNNKRKRAFRNLETMGTILILFHHEDWMQVQLVAKDLESYGKKIILWTTRSSEKTNTINIQIPLAMRVLQEEDYSKLWVLTSKTEKEFRGLKYDTLIDFTQDNGEGIEYLSLLLAINKALFCIGNREHVPRVYDLTVLQKENQDVLEFFGQIKVYLKNIIP